MTLLMYDPSLMVRNLSVFHYFNSLFSAQWQELLFILLIFPWNPLKLSVLCMTLCVFLVLVCPF